MSVSAEIADKPSPFQGVAADLMEQIVAGRLRPGDKLLATAKLAAHYGVAVPTAHRALAQLANQGYLTRQAGVGNVADRSTLSDTPSLRHPQRCIQGKEHCCPNTTDILM